MHRSNKILILLVVTVLVVAAAVMMTYRSSPQAIGEKEYVFPGLVDKINDLAMIEVNSKDGKLTIKRHAEQWVIEQSDNYPASFNKVRQVAVTLADLRILAAKTSNPSLYEKLGVEDPEGENSKSRRLTLSNSANDEIASLIVGGRRISSAPGGSQGYYIRIPGQAQALLVEGDLNISVKSNDWFEAEILNIDSKHISEVVIDHPDGSRVKLSRDAGTDDYLLADIPDGKEAQTTYTLNRAGSILTNVRVDDVRSADNFEFPDEMTVATVKTFDGMTARIKSTTRDDTNWAWFEFDYQAPVAEEEAAPAPEETPEEAAEEEMTDTPQEQTDQIDQQQVDQLKQKTAGWVYEIPSYKFELFTRKLDDLVKDIEPEAQNDAEKN